MERSGFFNAMKVGDTWDRIYKAENYAEYFASFIGNGVFPNPSTNLQVIGTDRMQVIVKSGKAWINGYLYENTDGLILPVDVADGVLHRIDKIVLRYDVVEREIRAKIKKGEFASDPKAPQLTRDADMYELGLADIKVNAGSISITQVDITDLRLNKELCGIVHGTIEQVDTTTIFNQYLEWYKNITGKTEQELQTIKENLETDFNIWFDGLKETLSGDVAGNLLNLININTENIKTKASNEEFDKFKKDTTLQLADITTYQTAGGTANAISLNLSTLVNGYATTFIVNKNNNKNATTINGKQLYKPNTTTAPNLVTGKAVSVWYDATKDCFFIKASAEGNAVAKDVLAGKIFSNDDDTGLVGTLDLSNLTSNNIKEGITINGVKGNVKPMKYGIILNLTTKIGYETSSGYSIPGGGYVLTGRTGPRYYIKCNGIEYYYDYNKSKPNYFPVPFNTGRILYYKGEHRYSTKLSSILKISTSRSNGYDYDIISSFDIAPAGYMPYQMLLVNNNWIILFTKESECIISTYDLNLSTKIKEISLNLDNPCLSYNHIFDIGNSTKIYDYTGKLIKSVEVMKPYDKLVDLNKNAAIGENEYDLGVVLHTEGSDCMCGNIVSPLL
ncbi:hypothetical protein [Clostridium botulinum]|uniref:hypothetical protein n=1 Tax=Clostridium botulinum TaxID=1491 RepID=UPI001FA83B84|nr:hypothetical protein [Clostridium botulinum]